MKKVSDTNNFNPPVILTMNPCTLILDKREMEAKPEDKLHCTKASCTAPHSTILLVIQSNSCAYFSAAKSFIFSSWAGTASCLLFWKRLVAVPTHGKNVPKPLSDDATKDPKGRDRRIREGHVTESSDLRGLFKELHRSPDVRANAEARAARLTWSISKCPHLVFSSTILSAMPSANWYFLEEAGISFSSASIWSFLQSIRKQNGQ